MTTFVAVTTHDVNTCVVAVDDSCHHLRHAREVDTLLSRIEWVIAQGRVASGRAWAMSAGLSPSYIGTLLTRLRASPDADARREEIGKLANAAGVSVEWLVTGVGSPDGERVTERDERYPSRAAAARFARDAGLDEKAIALVLKERLDADTDPGAMWWLEEIKRKHAELHDPFRKPKGRTVKDDDL